MGCVTPPWLMVSCLLADAVPNTVTSFTVWHNCVAAMPTPPARNEEKEGDENQSPAPRCVCVLCANNREKAKRLPSLVMATQVDVQDQH